MRRVELIECRVAGLALAGPLRMQMRLGPQIEMLRGGEALLGGVGIHGACGAVAPRLVCGAASAGLIHHINRVTLPKKKLRPSLAPVRSACEISPGLVAAMDHYDGPGMGLLGGDLKLGVQLAAHRLRGS